MTAPENNPIPTWPNPTGSDDIPPQPVLGPGAVPPPPFPSAAPQWQPPAVSAPPKKSPWAKVGSVGATLLVIVVVIGLKVGGGAFISNLFGEDAPPPPKTAFEGTPADAFAKGSAGIVLPAARAIADFTKEEVAAALAQVKEALIASRLSDEMLYEHDQTHLLALFAEPSAEDIRNAFQDHDGGLIATMIAPGHHLIPDGIRVKGEITFDSRTIDGVPTIEVKTNFIWVYAFTGALKEPGDHLVTVHDQHTWIFPDEDEVDPADRGMYLWGEESQSLATGVDCSQPEDLIALGERTEVDGGDHDPDAAFDPNGSLEVDEKTAC